MRYTVDPRVADDDGAFGQLQLCDLGPDTLILESHFLDQIQLFRITIGMHIGPEPEITLDSAGREIDDGFMEAVLE
jgi:hypothetical protein